MNELQAKSHAADLSKQQREEISKKQQKLDKKLTFFNGIRKNLASLLETAKSNARSYSIEQSSEAIRISPQKQMPGKFNHNIKALMGAYQKLNTDIFALPEMSV